MFFYCVGNIWEENFSLHWPWYSDSPPANLVSARKDTWLALITRRYIHTAQGCPALKLAILPPSLQFTRLKQNYCIQPGLGKVVLSAVVSVRASSVVLEVLTKVCISHHKPTVFLEDRSAKGTCSKCIKKWLVANLGFLEHGFDSLVLPQTKFLLK